MLSRFLLVFIFVPFLEVMILIQVGKYVGFWPTLFLLFGFGLLGFLLVRSQGLSVIHRIRAEIRAGRPPGDALVDGLLVFSGGLLLITPGLLTDAVGLLLMLPPVRAQARRLLLLWIRRRLRTRLF
ncbi:MAG: FxsA family protein [Bacillota bacterium]